MDIYKNRKFLEAGMWERWDVLDRDQAKGLPQPPSQKPYPRDSKLIDLIPGEALELGNISLKEVITNRRSRRKYSDIPLTLEELSFLLWATQGVSPANPNLRNVPSAGAKHPFETYLYINRVDELDKGLYRYLPKEHKLLFLKNQEGMMDKIYEACCQQAFVRESALMFFWTAIPYRTEWRYSILSHKMIAIDAGHLCQNLYLACEAIDGGMCAIGKYSQEKMNALLGVDGIDEMSIYAAALGKK